MKRTTTILLALAALICSGNAVVYAGKLQPRLTPVPDATVPSQRPAVQQPVPQQKPSRQTPSAAEAYPPSTTTATAIGPELLIGCWNLNVDSYLDMRLEREGKACADPAKIECVRTALKAKCPSVTFNFEADGCASVSKSICGKCEAKSGSWCVKCIDGQQMAVMVRSKHGFSKKCLDVTVCDDLHIRINSPAEIAGVYERAPDSVHEIGGKGTQPTVRSTNSANVPPAPDDVAP